MGLVAKLLFFVAWQPGAAGSVEVMALDGAPADFLVMIGEPLNEPVVAEGPWVVTNREDVSGPLRGEDLKGAGLCMAVSRVTLTRTCALDVPAPARLLPLPGRSLRATMGS